jgi:glycerophosphoryl diester phosphodiesterase
MDDGSNTRLYREIDVQGHRGCRGSLPENSLPGFLQALEWGVTTLEMDVVISKDHQVVLSHEPILSHHICIDSTGADLVPGTQLQYNMYQMTYEEIKSFDCGSKAPPEFPNQQSRPGPKPLLKDIIQAVENSTQELQLDPVQYSIEIKSMPGFDRIFHPEPKEFVALVLEVIHQSGIQHRSIVQSFDLRALEQVRHQAPEIKTSFLVDDKQEPLFHLVQLGFEPAIYSPAYRMVNDSLIHYLHEKQIAVIPWTVNDTTTMRRLLKMGVDGIITDYPEYLLALIED